MTRKIILPLVLFILLGLAACEETDEFELEGDLLDNPIGIVYNEGVLYISNANYDMSGDGEGFILAIDARMAVNEDTRKKAVIGKRTSDPFLSDLTIDPSTELVYSASRDTDEAMVFDVSDPTSIQPVDIRSDKDGVQGLPAGDEPYGVAIRPDGRFLYVTNIDSGDVSVIDLETNRLARNISLASGLVSIAVQPGTNYAYITNRRFNMVSVIDMEENTLAVSFEPVEKYSTLFSDTRGLAFTPDGAKAYIAVQDPPMLAVVDTEEVLDDPQEAIITYVPMHTRPYGVAVSPDGTECWVTNFDSKRILIVDTEYDTIVGRVDLGRSPTALVMVQFPEDDPEQYYVFATAFEGHSMAIIDGKEKVNLGSIR